MAYTSNNREEITLDPELIELAAGGKKNEAPVKADEKKEEPKVACFITKKEHLLSDTVELSYKGQKVRVAKGLVKFPL